LASCFLVLSRALLSLVSQRFVLFSLRWMSWRARSTVRCWYHCIHGSHLKLLYEELVELCVRFLLSASSDYIGRLWLRLTRTSTPPSRGQVHVDSATVERASPRQLRHRRASKSAISGQRPLHRRQSKQAAEEGSAWSVVRVVCSLCYVSTPPLLHNNTAFSSSTSVFSTVVSREGTTVGKQPTHFQGHPGSGSYCRRGLSMKSRPLEFYPGLT